MLNTQKEYQLVIKTTCQAPIIPMLHFSPSLANIVYKQHDSPVCQFSMLM